jgi:hypothetical protein
LVLFVSKLTVLIITDKAVSKFSSRKNWLMNWSTMSGLNRTSLKDPRAKSNEEKNEKSFSFLMTTAFNL